MAGPTLQSAITKTYNSYSGVDIITTMAGVVFGTLQGISVTIAREKAPVYTMGLPDARGFSRGKRGISGSLVFAVLDRASLLYTLADVGTHRPTLFQAKTDEIKFMTQRRNRGNGAYTVTYPSTDSRGLAQPAEAWYPDQILPFNIVLTAANEYGHRSLMEIRGVEILNNGTGMSIDDMNIDESMTFVATDVVPWHEQEYVALSGLGGPMAAISLGLNPVT